MKRTRFFLSAILFVTLILHQHALPQVKDPELPVSPEVEDRSSSGRALYSAEVTCSGGSFTGEIEFQSAGFTSAADGKFHYWQDISSIRIVNWVRYVKGRGYAFYPESYDVVLKNGEKQRISGNIKELNRFRLTGNRQRRTMYAYYYDDYIKGAWAATGVTDFYSPVLKPADGCVVSINFR